MPIDQPPTLTGPVSQSITIKELKPLAFVIQGGQLEPLVTIYTNDGSLKFGPGYSPDRAAKAFWEAISGEYRKMLQWKKDHGEQ